MRLTEKYSKTESYMLSCMSDTTHDREHVYRVLNYALDIAAHETGVDIEILVTASLLHDIGRAAQFADPAIDHAAAGAEMAGGWLRSEGCSGDFVDAVTHCISAHRYRSDTAPSSAEAKILFDADKVDVCGAVGIARTLTYCGQTSRSLYTYNTDGEVSDGADKSDSFFGEYRFKLEGLYDKFYTSRGAQLAAKRRGAAADFYNAMLAEVRECCNAGKTLWRHHP
jgi:uncharacterized protein